MTHHFIKSTGHFYGIEIIFGGCLYSEGLICLTKSIGLAYRGKAIEKIYMYYFTIFCI